jgi:hypothetical protein
MPKVVVCTISSKEKAKDREPLPARDRYLGSHVKLVADIAKKEKLPLFFLSGSYGFISEKEMIPNYDHWLPIEEVAGLVEHKVRQQLRRYTVDEVRFYTKLKPGWRTYLAAIQQATAAIGINLVVKQLDD